MDKLLYVFLIIFGGACSGIQAPVNSALGKRIGVFEGSLWSFATGTLFLILIVFLFGRGHISLVTEVPKWQLIGGVLGVACVVSMIVCAPQLGVGLAVVCMILGQITLALIIDTFGLFGVEQIPMDWNRILGILLIVAGVFFVYRSKFGV